MAFIPDVAEFLILHSCKSRDNISGKKREFCERLMMADEIDIEAFRELEQDLHRSEIRSSREAVSARLADDFLEFGSSGGVYNKAVVVDALAEEAPVDRLSVPEVHDFTAKVIAPDAVLVLYRSVRRSRGVEPAKTTLRSSIWKRIDGQWKMLFHQGTIIPDH